MDRANVMNWLSWTAVFFCLIMGALYIVAASSLNPKSLVLPDIDSSIFIYFGYGLRMGKVPYRDMVDHKGPLLWTIEWLGLTLGNGEMVGIWALEWIMMFFDLFLLFLCARFFIKNKLVCLAAAGLAAEPIVYLFPDGNYSEEWALPFILLSLYIFLDYLVKDKISFLRVFVCGMCMGAVLCLRANMIGMWISFPVIILFRMILKKDWKLAGKCIIGFLCGILAVILPFVVYYACEGALKDMWEWSIIQNVSYVEHGSSRYFEPVMIKFFWKEGKMLYLPLLGMSIVLLLRRKVDLIAGGGYLFYAISLLLCTLGGKPFAHYAMVLIPCLIIPVSYVLYDLGRFTGKYQYIIIFFLLLFLGRDNIAVQKNNIERTLQADVNNDSVVEYILENTEESDPILVMSLNAYYYVATRRLADTKYFIQHYMYDNDYVLYDTVVQEIEENPPKLIIMRKYNVDGDPWGEWMTRFYEEMCQRTEIYSVFETDFFVAFKEK